jgi:hypothetical protein
VDSPGATPGEGDGGMCGKCGQWWTITFGEVVVYEPSVEELELVLATWDESVQRFQEFKRRFVN